MEKRRDQQTRIESKTRAVVRINTCLSSGEYSRALDLLRGTAPEFPNDSELSELEKRAQEGVQRNTEANRLITESQELFAQRRSSEAFQSLRQAYELDKNNSLARSILANALVEHAQSIVEADWWEAETLTNQALALNPAHPTAKTIHSLILNQKMAGTVEEWISQTRKLQAAGNLSAALSQIAEGFVVYPHEPKLLQIQDEIQRDHRAERRQVRRRDLEDLRRTASEIDAAADDASKQELAERIKAAMAKYSTDGEILTVANGLLQRLGLVEVPQKDSTASSDGASVPGIQPAPRPIAVETPLATSSPANPAPPLPNGILRSQISSSAILARRRGPDWVSPKPIPGNVPTGNAPPSPLPPSKPSAVSPRRAQPEKIPSTPPEPQLLPPPTATAPAVEPSAPPAKVTTPSTEPNEPTRSNSTRMILISAAAIIVVATVSYLAGAHHAPPVAKTPAASPTIAAAPPVAVPAVSAPPTSTTQTAPEVPPPDVPAPSGIVTEKVTPADLPATNLGTLLIVAGQDNARVFLNGKLQRPLTQAGQLRLPNLELKDYVVQISKSGFQDPPPQTIHIRPGEGSRLVFNLQPSLQSQTLQHQALPRPALQPQPRLASLRIQAGTPGAAVLVDQTLVGAIQPDGTFSVSTVSPGDHTVELRKDRFQPRQFKKHFVVGAAVSLAAADATLEAASGAVKITYSPPDANVAIAKAGGLPIIVSSGVPLNLAAGAYTLTARTPEPFTRSATLEVVAGQSKTLDLSLAPSGMAKWDAPGAWKQEKDSFIRRGGDFVLYGVAPTSGTFVFSAMLIKGHLLQWVLNYSDPKNYVLFQMDDDNFYRTVIRNGQKTDEIKIPDRGDKKSFRRLLIRVSATEIVHQIKHGNSGTVLDRLTQPGANLSLGKFGFYIPGNDEVAISSFAHFADLKLP